MVDNDDLPRVYEGQSAADRLADFGLSFDDFMPALQGAEEEARTYTEFDAATASGLARWFRTVRLIRKRLIEDHGWLKQDSTGLPLVVHPLSGNAIVPATGNGSVGNPLRSPETKYVKGEATARAVSSNAVQLSLFDNFNNIMAEKFAYVAEGEPPKTWLFLYFREEAELRSELSLPEPMKAGHRVVNWRERIILPALPLSTGT